MGTNDHISPEALLAHDRAVAAGLDHYIDPHSGLLVMTALYLSDRGYCCDNGCRHCPWGEDTTNS